MLRTGKKATLAHKHLQLYGEVRFAETNSEKSHKAY